MGCGCGGNKPKAGSPGETLGYRLIKPDGTVSPDPSQAPWFTLPEAKAERRLAGGGTIRAVKRKQAIPPVS